MGAQPNSTAIEQLPEGMTYRKVKMSPELMKEWASRDEDCNRLVWNWGEPDADGFYTPIVEVRYDDNPLNALVEEAKDREQEIGRLRELASALDGYIKSMNVTPHGVQFGKEEARRLLAAQAATQSEQGEGDG
jgi:hypothetical protein